MLVHFAADFPGTDNTHSGVMMIGLKLVNLAPGKAHPKQVTPEVLEYESSVRYGEPEGAVAVELSFRSGDDPV